MSLTMTLWYITLRLAVTYNILGAHKMDNNTVFRSPNYSVIKMSFKVDLRLWITRKLGTTLWFSCMFRVEVQVEIEKEITHSQLPTSFLSFAVQWKFTVLQMTKSWVVTWRQDYLLQFRLCVSNIIHLYAKWKLDFVWIVAKTNSQKPNGSSPSLCVVKTVLESCEECFVVCYIIAFSDYSWQFSSIDSQKLALCEFFGLGGGDGGRRLACRNEEVWGRACLEMFGLPTNEKAISFWEFYQRPSKCLVQGSIPATVFHFPLNRPAQLNLCLFLCEPKYSRCTTYSPATVIPQDLHVHVQLYTVYVQFHQHMYGWGQPLDCMR